MYMQILYYKFIFLQIARAVMNTSIFLNNIVTFCLRFDKSLLSAQVKVTGYDDSGRARNGKNFKVFRGEQRIRYI